jgi:cellobiose transport system permease protein
MIDAGHPSQGEVPPPNVEKRPAISKVSPRAFWRQYVAISPFFILFAAFGIIPLVYAGWLSFQSWDGIGTPVFVGFDQFERLINDSQFWQALGTTLIVFIFGQVPLVVGACIGAALLSKLRGRGLFQTLFFLPQVTSLVMVSIVFQSMFSTSYGIVNRALEALGIPGFGWLENQWGIKVVLALMVIWRGFGYFLVVFIAGIAAIPTELYDAARVDGAGAIRTFVSITVPLLRPTVVFVSVTSIIGGLQIFTEPQVLFNGTGGPGNAGRTLMLLQYQYLVGGQQTAIRPDIGYASTIGWAIFAILLVLSLIYGRMLRRSLED